MEGRMCWEKLYINRFTLYVRFYIMFLNGYFFVVRLVKFKPQSNSLVLQINSFEPIFGDIELYL